MAAAEARLTTASEDTELAAVQVIASYSPADVVLRYAAQEKPCPPQAPERDDFEGAIGFIDISGFTALSERLAKEHGWRGSEKLNQYVNSYLSLLIDGVSLHGGDVVKFAGDALQVVWRSRRPRPTMQALVSNGRPSETDSVHTDTTDTTALADRHGLSISSKSEDEGTEPLSTLILRAAQCCLHLLSTLNNFNPPGVSGVSLTLHMGIGAGLLSGFTVGGHGGKWEYFVAGSPIADMAEATDLASSGELVLSARCHAELAMAGCASKPGRAWRQQGRTGSPLAEPPPADRWSAGPVPSCACAPAGHAASTTHSWFGGGGGWRKAPVGAVDRRSHDMERRSSIASSGGRRSSVTAPSLASIDLTPTGCTLRGEHVGQGHFLLRSVEPQAVRPADRAHLGEADAGDARDGWMGTRRQSVLRSPRGAGARGEELPESLCTPQCALAREEIPAGVSAFAGNRSGKGRRRRHGEEDEHSVSGRSGKVLRRRQAESVSAESSGASPSEGVFLSEMSETRATCGSDRSHHGSTLGRQARHLLRDVVAPTLRIQMLPALKAYVPELICERVQAGQLDGLYASEHRKLVSVFLKVLGLGARNCEVDNLMLCHAAVAVVQEKVQRHGGTLTRVITDDKGTRFLIAFGLPGRAHEDDEARAVLAALEISATLPRITLTGGPASSPLGRGQRVSCTLAGGLDSTRTSTTTLADSADSGDGSAIRHRRLGCATGITTGKVFCCEAGSHFRREYTLNGARVNVAARLMQAASKQGRSILVDSATFYGCAATGGACDFAELPAIVVKGKDEPVEIWEPLQPAGAEAEAGSSNSAISLAPSQGPSASVPASGSRPTAALGTPRAPVRPYAGGVGNAERRGERDRRSAAQVLKGTLGRHHEIDRLRSCLAQLHADQSTCTLLVGESGIGKTHLVGVLRALHAEANGSSDLLTQVGLLLNASRPIEATTPFFLWRAIFERLFTTATLQELARRSIEFGRDQLTPSIHGAGASAAMLTTAADRPGADRAEAAAGAGFLAPIATALERHDTPAHQRSSSTGLGGAPPGSVPSSPGPRRHGRLFGGGHGGSTPGFRLSGLILPKAQRSRRSPERGSAALSSGSASPKLMPSSPFRRFSRDNPTEPSRRSDGPVAASSSGSPFPMTPSARKHRPSPLGTGLKAGVATQSRSMLGVGTPQASSSAILGGAEASGGVRRRILRGLRCSASCEDAAGTSSAEASSKSTVGGRASLGASSDSPGVSRDGSVGSLSGHVAPWGVCRPPSLLAPTDDESRPELWPAHSSSNALSSTSPLQAAGRPLSSSPVLRNMPSRIMSHLSHHRRSNSTSPTRRWAATAAPDESGRTSDPSMPSRSASKPLSRCGSRSSSSHVLSPSAAPPPNASNQPFPVAAGGRAASSPLLEPLSGTVSSGNVFGTGVVASYLGGLFGLGRGESFHHRETIADADRRESQPPGQLRRQRSHPVLQQRPLSSPPHRKSPRATLAELALADAAMPPFAPGRASQLPSMPAGLSRVVAEGAPRHPRQRWRDAVSTALAYTLPPHALGCAGSSVLEGQVCIRPQADEGLLSSPRVLELAPLLNAVLPLGLPDNEVTKHLTGEMRLKEAIWLMVRVLRAKLASSRTILVFEDVHWMDSSSWKLLEAARRELSPLLLLVTMRPGAEIKLPPDGRALLAAGSRRELGGLIAIEVEQLLLITLEVESVPAEVAREVMDRSAGNPLFAMEFALSMRDEGLIKCEGRQCELLVRLDQIDFPPSVEALITSRFDRLPPASLLLLKVAAVCGSEFTVEMLLTMLATARGGDEGAAPLSLGIDSARVGSTLEALASGEADMLRRAEGLRPGVFIFKHRYLQEVAYDLTAEELKERLHSAAAAYFENLRARSFEASDRSVRSAERAPAAGTGGRRSRHGGEAELHAADAQPYLEPLVFHWTRAGPSTRARQRAVRYLKLLGDNALDNFSLVEAKDLHDEAIRLASADAALKAERGPLQRRMARRHYLQGEMAEAEEALTAALVSFDAERTPLNTQTDASLAWRSRLLKLAHLRQRLSPLTRWPVAGGPSVTSAEDSELAELASCYELLAQLHLVGHRVRLAEYCARRALALGLRLPALSPVVARSYAALLQVAASSGAPARTVSYFKSQALRTCGQLGEYAQLAFTLLAIAIHDASSAKWTVARDNLSKALGIVSELDDLRLWEDVQSHTGHAEFYAGNFAKSLGCYELALKSAQERQDKQMVNRCLSGIAAVYLATRRTADAHDILKSTNSYGQLALCLLRLGQADQALSYAQKVKDRFKGPRTKYYVLKAFSSTAEVFLRLLERAKADADADAGRPSALAFGGLLGNGATHSEAQPPRGALVRWGSGRARATDQKGLHSCPAIAEASCSTSLASSLGVPQRSSGTAGVEPSFSIGSNSVASAGTAASSLRLSTAPEPDGLEMHARARALVRTSERDAPAAISEGLAEESSGVVAEESSWQPEESSGGLRAEDSLYPHANCDPFTCSADEAPSTPNRPSLRDRARRSSARASSPAGESTLASTRDASAAGVPLEKLQSLADEWIDKLTQFGELYAVARPRALLLRGQLDMLTCKQRHGLRSFQRSLQAATRLGMGYDRALALLELGRHASDLSHAKRHLSTALDLFGKAGALYDYARCERISRAWERAASGDAHADDLLGELPDLPGHSAEEESPEAPPTRASSAGTPPPDRLRWSIPSPSPSLPNGTAAARTSGGMSPLPTRRVPRRSPPKRSSASFIFRGSAASLPPIGIKDHSTLPNGAANPPLKLLRSVGSTESAQATLPRRAPPLILHQPMPPGSDPDALSPIDHCTIALASLAPVSPAEERPAPLVR